MSKTTDDKTAPKVLMVFSERLSESSTRFGGFIRRLQKRPGLENIEIEHVALEDLVFAIHRDQATVFDMRTKHYLRHFNWVYFKRWTTKPDEAAALAIFLRANNIPFADHLVADNPDGGKLVTQFRCWASGVAVADMVYCAPHHLDYALDRARLSLPLVVKDVRGQKGQLNFLVKTRLQASEVVHRHPGTRFLVQSYIANKFDYRIYIYGGVAAVAVKRVGKDGSHLNNESAGGVSSFVPLYKVPRKVLTLAEQAARAADLQIAGVDVLPNLDKTKYVVLEVNRGSQIVTGDTSGGQVAIIDEFNKYVARMARLG